MARPQFLFLVHRVPYPPNRGDRIRSFHLLKFLSELGDVHLAFLHDQPLEPGVLDALRPLCRQLTPIAHTGRRRWLAAATSLATGGNATEALFRSTAMRQLVTDWASRMRFSVTVAFCSSMAQYGLLPALERVPLVLDLVDVDSQKWLDYAERGGGWKAPLYRLEAKRLRAREEELGQRARAVLLVSQDEADLYRGFAPQAKVHAISNGVDLDYFQPCEAAASVPDRCVFTGAMDYRANIDGVGWFCEHVWPGLRNRRPGAEFQIVGRDPTPEVQRWDRIPGVRVLGSVPDVRPYLAGASVAVAPLRVARGLQNKVLEALASARPVLASPQALGGIGLQVGTHALSAETPEQWIATLDELLADPERQHRLAQAGRDFVERECTWDSRLAPLATLLENLIRSTTPASSRND